MEITFSVVAYVSGLREDGSDSRTDYVLKKRLFLARHAQALAEFGNVLIEKELWKSHYPADSCNFRTVVETDLVTRPILTAIERKSTVLVVEAIDLCRSKERRTDTEQYAFEEFIYPFKSVIFAPDFSHADRLSPLERERARNRTYDDAVKISRRLVRGSFNAMTPDELVEFQDQILAQASSANSLLQSYINRMNRRGA